MRRGWVVAGLAMVATLAVTGCSSGSGGSGTPTPTKAGTELLSDATAKTKGQSYQFTTAYGDALTAQGAATGDGAATSAKVVFADATSGVKVNADLLVLKDGGYAKVDFGAASALVGISPNTWIHID